MASYSCLAGFRRNGQPPKRIRLFTLGDKYFNTSSEQVLTSQKSHAIRTPMSVDRYRAPSLNSRSQQPAAVHRIEPAAHY